MGNGDDWVGRGSVESDISDDEVKWLRREGAGVGIVEGGEVEEVPMEVDGVIAAGKGVSDGDGEIEVEDGPETAAGGRLWVRRRRSHG